MTTDKINVKLNGIEYYIRGTQVFLNATGRYAPKDERTAVLATLTKGKAKKPKTAKEAIQAAVNKAIAGGAPVVVEKPIVGVLEARAAEKAKKAIKAAGIRKAEEFLAAFPVAKPKYKRGGPELVWPPVGATIVAK